MISKSQDCFANISLTIAPIFLKFKTNIHKIVKNYHKNFRKDLCAHAHTRSINLCMRVLPRRNVRAHVYASCARVCAQIFTKNHLIILYYLINKSIKFRKDRSFCCGDISTTILTFVKSLIFYVFSVFSNFQHQSSPKI